MTNERDIPEDRDDRCRECDKRLTPDDLGWICADCKSGHGP